MVVENESNNIGQRKVGTGEVKQILSSVLLGQNEDFWEVSEG